jgi:hypothetical protein
MHGTTEFQIVEVVHRRYEESFFLLILTIVCETSLKLYQTDIGRNLLTLHPYLSPRHPQNPEGDVLMRYGAVRLLMFYVRIK